jgi:hypothetical protein
MRATAAGDFEGSGPEKETGEPREGLPGSGDRARRLA